MGGKGRHDPFAGIIQIKFKSPYHLRTNPVMSSGLISSHRRGWWVRGSDDTENEHRFMQDGIQLMKYLDPVKDNSIAWKT